MELAVASDIIWRPFELIVGCIYAARRLCLVFVDNLVSDID